MKNRILRSGIICLVILILSGLLSVPDRLAGEEPKSTPPAVGSPPVSLPAVQAQPAKTLSDALPPETLLFISAPDITAAKEKSKETILYRIYEFFTRESTKKAFKEMNPGHNQPGFPGGDAESMIKEKLGVTPEELFDILSGEVSLALLRFPGEHEDTPQLVLKIGVNDLAKLEMIISKIAGKELAKLDSYMLEKSDIKIYLIGPEEDPRAYFTIYQNNLILASEESAFEDTVKMLANMGPAKNSLTGSASYQSVYSHIKTGAASLLMYFNAESLGQSDFIKEMAAEMVPMAKMMGLNNLKALGYVITIKDGRFDQRTFIYAPGERKGLLEAMSMPRLSDKDGITLTSQSDYPESLMMITALAPVMAIVIPNLLGAGMMGGGGLLPAQIDEVTDPDAVAIASLKMLVSMEAIWRATDADGNGLKDLWTYDISSFHRFYRADGATKVNFIDINFAMADSAPASDDTFKNPNGTGMIEKWADNEAFTVTPKSGYLFRIMTEDETGTAYNQNEVNGVKAGNSAKFAFVAYPAEYGITGTNTYIVDQTGTIYYTDCGSNDAKIIIKWPGTPPTNFIGPGGQPWIPAE